MSKPFITTHRIYAEDVDHMGIVYHANHLRYFERARTELLRTNGFSLIDMKEQGVHFAVHDANLHYHAPARLDDLITINTSFMIKRATLVFHQIMINQLNDVLCEGMINVVCLNDSFKPRRIPYSLRSIGN